MSTSCTRSSVRHSRPLFAQPKPSPRGLLYAQHAMTTTRISPAVIQQLQVDAKTMTCKQMAEKYGTSPQAMRDRLIRHGIEFQRVRNNWSERLEELKAAAARMTTKELAEHFGMEIDYAYTLLQRLNVKAAASTWPVRFAGGIEAMKQHAPNMTVAELAAHFEIDRRTVRLNLKRLGLECKSVERPPKELKVKVKRVAVKKAAPRAKVRATQSAKPAPKPAPAPVPQRAAAPKPTAKHPVQIVVPADVKITIVEFCPPPGSRICNGSSTQHYSPAQHGGAMRSCR